MTNGEATSYWFESAKETIKIATDTFKLKHYDWSLFFWHLVIEKTLKGIITKQRKVPPASHDLLKLANFADLSLDSSKEAQLSEISTYNLEARYDDYKHSFYKKATESYTRKWVNICKELYLWLLKQK